MKCPKCQFDNPSDSKFCKECGTQLLPSEEISVSHTKTLETPIEELTTGSTFAGRYQIIEELGKGGMGKVYKAHDTEIKEKIALKLLKPEIAADEKTIERFRNEIRLARKIVHKNVGRMYDLGKEEGSYYITMEFVPGQDLKGLIRQSRQLTVGTTINIAKQVCEGLGEAHRLGVVHRDLKPSNIMIDKDGNARIMDFGIARSLKAKGITGAGVMIGTPEYMSPEQVEGKETDQRSDIYSLGVILYEMVTGRVPFEGETPFTIGVKHKSETPKDPKELNTQIPEDLSHVILRCLKKDKESRYQSAGEVRSELTRLEKGIPTAERIVPKRKPLTSKEITVTFGLKKLFIPALVIVALAIAAVIIWQLLLKKEAIPVVPSDKSSLAVMYFENNTGDESLDHWSKALSGLLIADLTQSKYIRVLSGDRLYDILSELNQLEAESFSSKVLKEVASRGRVTHILRGSYTKAGDNFRINTIIQEASTMEALGSERVEGKGEESFHSMVDDLTRRIKANFKLSPEQIASDIDREIIKITTSYPEAYKYYSEGRKYHGKGEYRKSIQLMERAVAVDPEFAMAYRSMSASYSNLQLFSERTKYTQKALDLTDRLSDREYYLIQGDFFRRTSEKTYDKAIEAYTKLLDLYPEDLTGNSNLAILYSSIEEWDRAIEKGETVIQNKSKSIVAYRGLASAYRAKGLYNKAKVLLEDYINNISDNAAVRRSLAQHYIIQGKLDLALAEADNAFYLDPTNYSNIRTKGDVYLYRGDLTKAEEEYRNLLNSREPAGQRLSRSRLSQLYKLQGRFESSKRMLKKGVELSKKFGQNWWKSRYHSNLARIYLITGNPEESLKECDMAWDSAAKIEYLYPQRESLYIKALAFLEMKSMDEAKRATSKLKEMIEKGMNKKLIRYYYHLMGIIELEGENFSQAVECFKKAISLLPTEFSTNKRHAIFFDSLASAYYESGATDKAQEEYERITALTVGRLNSGDIYVKSFYMLGKIYEQQGNKAKAIEHYEKFLTLWKNADPGIAEVKDVRERVAGLKE